MSKIYFDDCDITINNTGVLAQNASLSENIQLSALYSAGKRGPVDYVPDGAPSYELDISYLIDLRNDPVFPLVDDIRNILNGSNIDPIPISISNISGEGYLTNFSFNANPNAPLEGNATFVIFSDLSGEFISKPDPDTGVHVDFSIAHGWGMVVKAQDGFRQGSTYNVNYSFGANWSPIYTIGNTKPSQVALLSAEENFGIVRDEYTGIGYSGQSATAFLFSVDPNKHIEIRDIEKNCQEGTLDSLSESGSMVTLNLTDAYITKGILSASLDESVKVSYTIVKNY